MFKLNENIYITSERGCSLYESNETYESFLYKSRKGKIVELKRDIAKIDNGFESMWFYQSQLIKEEEEKEFISNNTIDGCDFKYPFFNNLIMQNENCELGMSKMFLDNYLKKHQSLTILIKNTEIESFYLRNLTFEKGKNHIKIIFKEKKDSIVMNISYISEISSTDIYDFIFEDYKEIRYLFPANITEKLTENYLILDKNMKIIEFHSTDEYSVERKIYQRLYGIENMNIIKARKYKKEFDRNEENCMYIIPEPFYKKNWLDFKYKVW